MVGRGNDVIDLLPPIPAKLPALLVCVHSTTHQPSPSPNPCPSLKPSPSPNPSSCPTHLPPPTNLPPQIPGTWEVGGKKGNCPPPLLIMIKGQDMYFAPQLKFKKRILFISISRLEIKNTDNHNQEWHLSRALN